MGRIKCKCDITYTGSNQVLSLISQTINGAKFRNQPLSQVSENENEQRLFYAINKRIATAKIILRLREKISATGIMAGIRILMKDVRLTYLIISNRRIKPVLIFFEFSKRRILRSIGPE